MEEQQRKERIKLKAQVAVIFSNANFKAPPGTVDKLVDLIVSEYPERIPKFLEIKANSAEVAKFASKFLREMYKRHNTEFPKIR